MHPSHPHWLGPNWNSVKCQCFNKVLFYAQKCLQMPDTMYSTLGDTIYRMRKTCCERPLRLHGAYWAKSIPHIAFTLQWFNTNDSSVNGAKKMFGCRFKMALRFLEQLHNCPTDFWAISHIRALDPKFLDFNVFINEKPLKWYIITRSYIPYLPIFNIDIKCIHILYIIYYILYKCMYCISAYILYDPLWSFMILYDSLCAVCMHNHHNIIPD